MTIVPASQLSPHDLRMLGNNLTPRPRNPRNLIRGEQPPNESPEPDTTPDNPPEPPTPAPANPEPIELPPAAWQRDA